MRSIEIINDKNDISRVRWSDQVVILCKNTSVCVWTRVARADRNRQISIKPWCEQRRNWSKLGAGRSQALKDWTLRNHWSFRLSEQISQTWRIRERERERTKKNRWTSKGTHWNSRIEAVQQAMNTSVLCACGNDLSAIKRKGIVWLSVKEHLDTICCFVLDQLERTTACDTVSVSVAVSCRV